MGDMRNRVTAPRVAMLAVVAVVVCLVGSLTKKPKFALTQGWWQDDRF